MKKRWGVRVIAILMLIVGLLLLLLGIVPAIRMAVRGTGMGLEAWLALPSVFGGCIGALFLLISGSLLLTLVKIADNFAAAAQPTEIKAAAAPAVVVAPLAAGAESFSGYGPTPPPVEPAAVSAVVAEQPGAEAGIVAAAVPLQEAEPLIETGPAEMSAVAVAAEAPEPHAVEVSPPQEEISVLQSQLAALQAQLDELEGAPSELEELPPVVEDEGPAPGASDELKLPGADEAARVAAEMAVLDSKSEAEEPQEH